MARTKALLGAGPRLSDYLSAGLLARAYPRELIEEALAASGKASLRRRDFPAETVAYYVMALGLYSGAAYEEVFQCMTDGLAWLSQGVVPELRIGKSGISQARTRLGWEVMREIGLRRLRPLAGPDTPGAWYRGRRLVSLDGSCLEVADEAGNAQAFGYPGTKHGEVGYPQAKFVALVETGTHAMLAVHLGRYGSGETTLAQALLPKLTPDMLCLADRGFISYDFFKQARATGAQLLWRGRKNLILPAEKVFADGSYLSALYPDAKAREAKRDGIPVRVIDYRIEGIEDAEPLYRLLTTLTDPRQAPAGELAALYHERWEIESIFDEFKTHLRGAKRVLRSKTPDLVRQEFYGLVLTHYAIRELIHQAALERKLDPDRLSFTGTVQLVRRKLPQAGAISP